MSHGAKGSDRMTRRNKKKNSQSAEDEQKTERRVGGKISETFERRRGTCTHSRTIKKLQKIERGMRREGK